MLDSDQPTPPPGIEATHAPLDANALGWAALACSDPVNTLWPDAVAAAGGEVERLPKAADLVHRK